MARHGIARLLPALLFVALTLPLTGCDLIYDWLEMTPEQRQVADIFTEKDIVKIGGEPGEVVNVINDLQAAVAPIYEFEPLHTFTKALAGFQVKLPLGVADQVKAKLLDDPRVEYIVLDPDKNQLPPDKDRSTNPATGNEITDAIARIGGPFTDDLSTIEVAVVDTGVDLDHPDLNVVGGKDVVGDAGGEVSAGGDDLNEHGTHVAGTIGAKANGSGVAGVAPGVGIHAVRVLDSSGSGNLGDIIAGLEYVLSVPKIKVVNMSLGGGGSTAPPAPLKEAIDNLAAQGVVVCIAAGNEAQDTDNVIPAGYNSGIVVSAYDTDGNLFADFSNYGSAVDIAAPGVEITSTVPGGGYANLSGTSMATPHVAGAAAAYLAKHPGTSAAAVISAITSSGESGYAGQGGDHPEKLLNLTDLLQ